MTKRTQWFAVVSAVAVLLVAGSQALAGWTTEDTYANADAMLNSAAPDTNYGDSTVMWFKGGRNFPVQFDLPTVPNYGDGVIVEQAYAQIYSATFYNAVTANVYKQTQAWDEMQTTWNSASTGTPWATAGGWGPGMSSGTDILDTRTVGSKGYYSWDITSAAQDWMNDPSANHGVLFECTTGNIKFASRENTNVGWEPKMNIKWRVKPNEVVDYSLRDVVREDEYHASNDVEYVGDTSGGEFVTWLKFDLPALTGHTLKEAWLDFGPFSSHNSVYEPKVTASSDSNDAWTVRSYAETTDGIDVLVVPSNSDGSHQGVRTSVDITDMVMAAGEGLGKTLTIKLWRSDSSGYRGLSVVDPNFTTLSLVTEIPEPATLALVGMGALGLLRRRR